MKICIWCRRSETKTSFNQKAHTFPKSLGGDNICENVCDECNHYFGSPTNMSPAVEVVLKEMLNISKFILLESIERLPNKFHFKSQFFNVNKKIKSILLKPSYKIQKGYQAKLGRLFRRGIYKVFLEEFERQRGDALNSRYDFIREFARYNIGDYPIYIMKWKHKAVFFSLQDTVKPEIRFTKQSDDDDNKFKIFEYQIIGHNFCIPTSQSFVFFHLEKYKLDLIKNDHAIGTEIFELEYAENIDYTYRHLDK